MAAVKINDQEFLGYFEEIEKMDDAEKKALKMLLEAMVMRSRMRAMVGKES